jgi:hypothetical protein
VCYRRQPESSSNAEVVGYIGGAPVAVESGGHCCIWPKGGAGE